MIVVNPSTRQFNIPGADLVFGVESDSGSVRKYFQCPRHVGNNLDLAASFIRMNYRNANGEIDSYLVQDVAVDGENVLFSWLLSPKTTMYKGQLSFVMCVVGPDTKVQWHTTLGRGQVLEGLEPDSAIAEEGTADVVAQLIAMVEAQTETVSAEGDKQIKAVQTATQAAQAAAVAEIESKRVNSLNSIPNDYTSLANAVGGLTRGRAGAIVCEAAGTVIAVNDASDMAIQSMKIFGRSTQDGVPTPDAPVEIKSVESPVVRLSGKNLFPGHVTNYTGVDGSTVKVNTDGSITVHKVARNLISFKALVSFPPGTYVISNGLNAGHPVYIQVFNITTNSSPSRATQWPGGETAVFLYSREDAEGDVTIFPQIELGDVATAYEPYKPIQTVETVRTLRGIPVTAGGNYTDENGQQWICDEVDLERGVYVQRTKTATLTGAINIGKSLPNDETSWMYYYVTPNKEMDDTAPVMCDRLRYNTSLSPYNSVGFRNSNDGNSVIYFNMSTYMTENNVDALGAVLKEHPITFVYALATPIETPLSETEIAAYRALHTNKPNTTILNDGGAHMKVEYAADTKLYIDNKFAALMGK